LKCNWYAVSTKPQQERQEELHIKQLGGQVSPGIAEGEQSYPPEAEDGHGPISPGYLFPRFELERHDRAVNYATGIRKVVEFGSRLFELDPAMIDAIKGKAER
jgi:Transcription termination factor nusG